MAGVPNRLRSASADKAIAEQPADHDGRSAVDLADYRLLVSSLLSSPGSIIPGGVAGIVHVLRCLLAEADLLMAVDGYPTIADLSPQALVACRG